MEVLVFVHVKVVERVSVRWVPITESEVDCDVKLDFTSAENVFEESVSLVELKCLEVDCLILTLVQGVLFLFFLKLGNVASEISKISVLSGLLRLKEFYSDFTLRVFIRKLRC